MKPSRAKGMIEILRILNLITVLLNGTFTLYAGIDLFPARFTLVTILWGAFQIIWAIGSIPANEVIPDATVPRFVLKTFATAYWLTVLLLAALAYPAKNHAESVSAGSIAFMICLVAIAGLLPMGYVAFYPGRRGRHDSTPVEPKEK